MAQVQASLLPGARYYLLMASLHEYGHDIKQNGNGVVKEVTSIDPVHSDYDSDPKLTAEHFDSILNHARQAHTLAGELERYIKTQEISRVADKRKVKNLQAIRDQLLEKTLAYIKERQAAWGKKGIETPSRPREESNIRSLTTARALRAVIASLASGIKKWQDTYADYGDQFTEARLKMRKL